MEWKTANNERIEVHPYQHSQIIRGPEMKLYGGPQLERLLSVFRVVFTMEQVTTVTDHEIEEAIAVNFTESNRLSEISSVVNQQIQFLKVIQFQVVFFVKIRLVILLRAKSENCIH